MTSAEEKHPFSSTETSLRREQTFSSTETGSSKESAVTLTSAEENHPFSSTETSSRREQPFSSTVTGSSKESAVTLTSAEEKQPSSSTETSSNNYENILRHTITLSRAYQSIQGVKDMVVDGLETTAPAGKGSPHKGPGLTSALGSTKPSSSTAAPDTSINLSDDECQVVEAKIKPLKRHKPSSGFKDFQYEVPGLHNKMKKKDPEIINLASSDEEVEPVRNGSSEPLPVLVPINKVPKVQLL